MSYENLSTTYRFQYATQADFSDAVTDAQGVRSPNLNADIHDRLTGLQPHTTYYLRLQAENADGSTEAVAASTFETLETAAPGISGTWVASVNSSEATLNAQIDPAGLNSDYHFEYVDQAGYEASGFAGAASTPTQTLNGLADPSSSVSAGISGLQPASNYYYRVLVSNSKGDIAGPAKRLHTFALPEEAPDSCPNAERRAEQQSGELPNCRAYEMASPPDKNGGDVHVMSERTAAATDGNAIVFPSFVYFGDVRGGGFDTDYLAQRTGTSGTSGWSTHGITPETGTVPVFGNIMTNAFLGLFTPDLSSGIFRTPSDFTGAPNVAPIEKLFRVDGLRGGGEQITLLSDAASPIPIPANLSLVEALKPYPVAATPDLTHVLFESRASLLPDAPVGSNKLYEYVEGSGLRLVQRLPNGDSAESAQAVRAGEDSFAYPPAHAISDDGSRIFFQAPQGNLGGALYMREDGTTTVQVNASELPSPEEPQNAILWAASADGSRAFFTTSERLSEADDQGTAVYMWQAQADNQGHHLTLLSPGIEATSVIGASDDGDYVYFFSGPAIYVWHDGTLQEIAQLQSQEEAPENYGTGNGGGDPEARVTPDGRHLLFVTRGDKGVAGKGGFFSYDHGNCNGGQGCLELYLYSADTGEIECASCSPSGARAEGSALNFAVIGTSALTRRITRALSEDGRYAFFTSGDPLLPEDTNGALDAYEYDGETGKLHLLSSGTSPEPSYFVEASPDGSNAFIVTKEQLVDWDKDTSADLYDVRIDGGFPNPPPGTAPCEGESCRGAAVPTPPLSAVGSSQEGPGNRKPRCPKGRKPRGPKGRCAKPRTAKKHHTRSRAANEERRAGK